MKNYHMTKKPTPNNHFVYLRDLQVTDHHWSLRGDMPYPAERKRPLDITRPRLEDSTQ